MAASVLGGLAAEPPRSSAWPAILGQPTPRPHETVGVVDRMTGPACDWYISVICGAAGDCTARAPYWRPYRRRQSPSRSSWSGYAIDLIFVQATRRPDQFRQAPRPGPTPFGVINHQRHDRTQVAFAYPPQPTRPTRHTRPGSTHAQRGNELGNGTADEHSGTLMRTHEPSVAITAGRSQPPTGNEFVVPPGNTAGRSFHQCPSAFIRGSPPVVNRFQDAQPLQTGPNG